MHAPDKAHDIEDAYPSGDEIEEVDSQVSGEADEEGERRDGDPVGEVIKIVAREIDMHRSSVEEGIAQETQEAVAEVIDHTGTEKDRQERDDGERMLGQDSVEDKTHGQEHEGCDESLLGGAGKVGLAQHAGHGTRVDKGLQEVEHLELLAAEEEAEQEY